MSLQIKFYFLINGYQHEMQHRKTVKCVFVRFKDYKNDFRANKSEKGDLTNYICWLAVNEGIGTTAPPCGDPSTCGLQFLLFYFWGKDN